MNSELHYLSLFVRAIAKCGCMTGLIPGIAIAILAEKKFRIVEVGIEKVSVVKFRGRAVSPRTASAPTQLNRATSSPRKVRRYA